MRKKIIIIFIWILLWQGLSLLVGNRILLVGPWETLCALGRLAVTGGFWQSLGWTLLRLLLGILLGTGLGFCVAYLAGHKPLLREFLQPAVHFMKAIPVVSFVILLLIWLTARLSTIPLMEAQKLAEAGKPIPETGAKELRYLARNFNRMQEKLNANKEVDP